VISYDRIEHTLNSDVRKISSAAIAFLVFMFFIFCVDRYLLTKPSIYKSKQQLCFTKLNKARILILGSSHALFGIRPDCLSGWAVNLSNVSQSLDLDEKLLYRALENNPSFKLVVVPVSYFSLEESLTNTTEEWRDCLYLRYFGISERSLWQVFLDPRYWSLPFLYRSDALPWRKLSDEYTLASYSIDGSGWVANDKRLELRQAQEMGYKRVKLFQSFMKPQSLILHEKILGRIIDFCRTHHVKVLLVTMPCWKTFREFANSSRVAQTKAYLESLVLPQQVLYADYWGDERFVLSDFADTDHLNSNGASKFSHLLDNEFVRSILN